MISIKSSLQFGALCLSLSAFSTVSRAQLILNGDFSANAGGYYEDVGYDSTQNSNNAGNPSNPTDWTPTTVGVGVGGSDTHQGYQGFKPASTAINTGGSVNDYVFLQGNNGGAISQSFQVTSGDSYALTFVAGSRSLNGEDNDTPILATISDASGTLLFSQTGGLPDSEFYANTTPGLLTTSVGTGDTFVADMTGLVTLNFSVPNPPPSGYGDYTVAVSEVNVSEVPEPSTWALALSGVGVLAFVARRRLLVV